MSAPKRPRQAAPEVSGSPSVAPLSSFRPSRVWIVFDRSLFSLASRLSGDRLESAWSSFWLLAEGRGRGHVGTPCHGRPSAALELEVLHRDCGSRVRAPGHDVSVLEFAHGHLTRPLSRHSSGSGTLVRVRPDSKKVSLFVTFEVFRDGTGLHGVDLWSAWCRFWCLAEAGGHISEVDSPAVVFDVAL